MGHDLFGLERYSPHTRHMVVVDILTFDSPVGCPGERYRFFLSDDGYKNAKKSAGKSKSAAMPLSVSGGFTMTRS